MLIVPVKEGENIERALKKFKKKFERTGAVKNLRARQQFINLLHKKRARLRKRSTEEKLKREEEC